MFQKTLDRLSENPRAWNILRRHAENGVLEDKEVIERELDPWRDAGRAEFLDFGCGTGEFAPCFPAQHYTGVDVALHYLRYASRSYLGNFAVMSGAAISLA